MKSIIAFQNKRSLLTQYLCDNTFYQSITFWTRICVFGLCEMMVLLFRVFQSQLLFDPGGMMGSSINLLEVLDMVSHMTLSFFSQIRTPVPCRVLRHCTHFFLSLLSLTDTLVWLLCQLTHSCMHSFIHSLVQQTVF